MSAPLMPSPLDYIGRRPFALYPAIRDTGPNQWRLTGSHWSEIQVSNATSGEQLWIPRQYVRGVSDLGGLPLVVELTGELSPQNGSLAPAAHHVIEMPHIPNAPVRKRRKRGPAPVVGIRMEKHAGSGRAIARIGLGLVALSLISALALEIARL